MDDQEDILLQDIERNPQAHLPTFIEISDMKRPMSVTTTYQKQKASTAEVFFLKLKIEGGTFSWPKTESRDCVCVSAW